MILAHHASSLWAFEYNTNSFDDYTCGGDGALKVHDVVIMVMMTIFLVEVV